jgi:hypothetical protein
MKMGATKAEAEGDPERVPSCVWAVLALASLCSVPITSGVAVPVTPDPVAWTSAILDTVVGEPVEATRTLTLVPFDPLIWLTGAWLLVAWIRSGAFLNRVWQASRTLWPVAPLFLIAGLSLSAVDTNQPGAETLFLKTMVQYVEYLLLAPLTFGALLSSGVWRTRALWAFAATGTVVALSGWADATIWGAQAAHPAQVGGLLQFRSPYGVYLLIFAAMLPSVGEETPESPWGSVLVSGLAIALALGLLGSLAGGPTAGALLAGSIALYGAGTFRTKHGTASLALALVLVLFVGLLLTSRSGQLKSLIQSVQVYTPYEDPETGATSREHAMRYYRWSANLQMLEERPILGVGLGQYEKRVGEHYLGVPLPAGRTDRPETYDVKTSEPMSFGWFFVLLAEMGLLGGVALGVLFLEMLRRGVRAACDQSPAGWTVIGALAGLLIAGWFTEVLAKGTGPAFGFLVALALWPRPSHAPETDRVPVAS